MSRLRFVIVSLILALGLVAAEAQLVNRVGFNQRVFGSGGGGSTLLLDESGLGSAAAAFGTIKLRAAYAGDLMRLRRASDNAEDNAQPDASGELSLTSPMDGGGTLADWATTDDVFLVTWFDQSGNSRDITQATASLQPLVLSSGAIIVGSNSKAAVRFDGAGDYLKATAFTLNQPATYMVVLNIVTYTLTDRIFDGDSNYSIVVSEHDSGTELSIFAGTAHVISENFGTATWRLGTFTANGASSAVRLNANSETTGDAGSNAAGGLTLAANASGNEQANIEVSVFVVWPSDLDSTAETTARNNLNATFTLY